MTARIFCVTGFCMLAILAWAFLWQSELAMSTMSPDSPLSSMMNAMMQPHVAVPYLTATSAMWVTMMIAMMTPAVLPMMLVFWRLDRGNPAHRVRDGSLFSASYLVVWCGFGIAMAALQWSLHRGALLHSHLLEVAPRFAGWIALAAGLYQWTPLKATCLSHCQSPLGFLLSHWRGGAGGAIHMGIAHGTYCLGCCWALMLLMFIGGVMSVGVMIAVSLFILLERLLPAGPWISKLPGAFLIGWGGWALLTD